VTDPNQDVLCDKCSKMHSDTEPCKPGAAATLYENAKAEEARNKAARDLDTPDSRGDGAVSNSTQNPSAHGTSQRDTYASKQGAIMDSYLAVSSNDMLSHLSLPKSPETLCGKIVVAKATAHLKCDICETLSGGNFIKTNEVEGSISEQAFDLHAVGNPHYANLDMNLDDDDVTVLKAFAILAAEDDDADEEKEDDDPEFTKLLDDRSNRPRVWQDRNDEHKMPEEDLRGSFAPTGPNGDSEPLDPALRDLLNGVSPSTGGQTRVRKVENNPELAAVKLKIQNDLLQRREPDAEDIERFTALGQANKLGAGPGQQPLLHKLDDTNEFQDQTTQQLGQMWDEAEDRAITAPQTEPIIEQPAGRFGAAAARLRGRLRDVRADTSCLSCSHDAGSHTSDAGGHVKCKGEEGCGCQKHSDKAGALQKFMLGAIQATPQREISGHQAVANNLYNTGDITKGEHSFIQTTLDFPQDDYISTYPVLGMMKAIRGGKSVEEATTAGHTISSNIANKTATNWTLDGTPIEDGFTLMTSDEANAIPFLDTNKVSISTKVHCAGCDTDQWFARVASCVQCNEFKCLNCMDDIINEFVGSCKKCANIDEDEETFYLNYEDTPDITSQQFFAAFDDNNAVDDSFLPHYDD